MNKNRLGLLQRFNIKRHFLFFAIFLLALPVVFQNNFHFDLATIWLLSATACLGLNVLVGYAGQISLAHGAFWGLGGYTSAILATRYNLPPLLCIVLSTFFVCVLSYVITRPILKLRGHYLALATLAIGIIIYLVLRNESDFTGGPDGMKVVALSVLGRPLKNVFFWYYLATSILLLCMWMANNLLASSFGRALMSINENEFVSFSLGINSETMKAFVFQFSVFLAAFSGSLYAFYAGFISPSDASFLSSLEFLIMAVLGGLGSLYGSVLGAAFVIILPQFLLFFNEYKSLLLGLIIVLVMMFAPGGMVSIIEILFFSLYNKIKSKADTGADAKAKKKHGNKNL